ncbi:MAG: hypothetical protein ACFFEA_00530 [Candidatus Thorarchaeota archaeon]
MVHGPCRGKMCDFWARVKLRKTTLEELARDILISISECNNPGHTNLDDALDDYWTDFGVKDIWRFCEEEPSLCSKMKLVNAQVKMLMN